MKCLISIFAFWGASALAAPQSLLNEGLSLIQHSARLTDFLYTSVTGGRIRMVPSQSPPEILFLDGRMVSQERPSDELLIERENVYVNNHPIEDDDARTLLVELRKHVAHLKQDLYESVRNDLSKRYSGQIKTALRWTPLKFEIPRRDFEHVLEFVRQAKFVGAQRRTDTQRVHTTLIYEPSRGDVLSIDITTVKNQIIAVQLADLREERLNYDLTHPAAKSQVHRLLATVAGGVPHAECESVLIEH